MAHSSCAATPTGAWSSPSPRRGGPTSPSSCTCARFMPDAGESLFTLTGGPAPWIELLDDGRTLPGPRALCRRRLCGLRRADTCRCDRAPAAAGDGTVHRAGHDCGHGERSRPRTSPAPRTSHCRSTSSAACLRRVLERSSSSSRVTRRSSRSRARRRAARGALLILRGGRRRRLTGVGSSPPVCRRARRDCRARC